jgi:energy-coupling factor transport system permease protein
VAIQKHGYLLETQALLQNFRQAQTIAASQVKPKLIHPITWWIIGLSISLSATLTQSLTTLVFICAAGLLPLLGGINFFNKMKLYLLLAIAMVISRIIFRLVFNPGNYSGEVLLSLPEIELNLGFGSLVSMFGNFTSSALIQSLTEGLRLSAIILGVGFSAAMANPRQLLKSTPAALYEISTAVSMALNLAPQLIASSERVRQARKLRGRSNRLGTMSGIIIPVLEDSIDASLELAASMDARGFGRVIIKKLSLLVSAMILLAIALAGIGSYLLVAVGSSQVYFLVVAIALSLGALIIGSLNNSKTQLIRNRFARYDLVALACCLIYWLFVVSRGGQF